MAKGWLDNYGKEDNYNDSSVSAPEGFQGDGYSNVGRNYSPAWGGQFQNGGKSPKYVESKNDPRYKAYQDSLTLYNASNRDKKILFNKNIKTAEDWQKYIQSNSDTPKEVNSYKRLTKLNNKQPKHVSTTNRILPFEDKKFASLGPIPSTVYNYKKPQQQVIVKEKKPEYTLKEKYDYDPGYRSTKEYEKVYNTPQVHSIENNLRPAGLVQGDFNIDADTEIHPEVRRAKYYDVEDFTHGSTNYNGRQTNYRTSDLSSLEEQSPNNTRKITPHYQMGGSVYPVNYVPEAQMGGSLPGATGHMYARYEEGGKVPGDVGFSYPRTGEIPSNGPYAKKTMASAQNGKEMQYYQNGLDWQPKTISKDGSVIKDDRGQWDYPWEDTEISGDTMRTDGYGNIPLYVVPDVGEPRMVYPNTGTHTFPGATKFTEYPKGKKPNKAQNGLRQEQKGLQNLDNLTNFTNYNKPQPGGWLNKYN